MRDAATASVESAHAHRCARIVEEALVGVYTSTPAGRLVFCNATFAQLLGFASVDEAIGTAVADLYESPSTRDAFLEQIRNVRQISPQRARLLRRDGQAIDVLEAAVGEFDAEGALLEIRGQIVDITTTVAMEGALLEREGQFRAIFNDAADSILILDEERGVVDANAAARRLFAIEACGVRRLDDALAEPQALASAWTELLALGEIKLEHRVACGPHAGRQIECSYRASVHAGRHLCIARDITDRRMLEGRLQEAHRIETVGRLAGGIAHDFNNLLTAMLGYTELLLANDHMGERERADLLEIQKAGQRAAALTQQLLAFGRKQVLVAHDVELNEALTGLRSMLQRLIREDIVLTIRTAAAPAFVRIDRTQFEQVIVNLVMNARDAVPGGGRIEIEIDRRAVSEQDAVMDGRVPAGDYVRVRVCDNGVGMTPEVRAHLFEPFFTTKAFGKGTGLGLASVYGVVRQSNGYVTVESEPGAGTSVVVHLPAVAQARPPDQPEPAHPAAGGAETILLVEDEDAVRVIVGAVLRRNGYTVLEASTPRGAREIFARHGAEIELLLTDVIMPEMNGPALAQRLVAERPNLRVLFISGYTDLPAPFAADNPNMSFLSKPFQASALIERVRSLLGRPRAEGAQ